MSADNGVYIGIFENNDLVEYRVIYASAIDNLTYLPDTDDGFDARAVSEYFNDAKTANCKTEAYMIADKLAEEVGYLEYGVSCIKFKHSFEFYKNAGKDVIYSWEIN